LSRIVDHAEKGPHSSRRQAGFEVSVDRVHLSVLIRHSVFLPGERVQRGDNAILAVKKRHLAGILAVKVTVARWL